ncbi:hypothetical protein [Azotosporobacter soli]|uniref:hypothetical protein n=1 Tax=Azotosporobacter soli TaxID=3055040 RepID=UPI0031FF1035
MNGWMSERQQSVKGALATQYPTLLLLGRSGGRLLAAKRRLPAAIATWIYGGTVS